MGSSGERRESPTELGERVADPDGPEPEHELADGVEGGGAELAAPDERERVETERRERREATQDSHDDEGAAGFADVDAGRGNQSSDDPDREAADDVDEEDPQRKLRSEAYLDHMVGKVAEERARAAANGNRQ